MFIFTNTISEIGSSQLLFSNKNHFHIKNFFAAFFLIFFFACNSELKELRFDYNAFPDLINIDGKIICVFYNGWEHGSFPERDKLMSNGGSIYMSISNDEGHTWSEPHRIIDTPLDDRDPSLTFFNGRLICSYFQVKAKGSKMEFNTMISESFDEGLTWSLPRVVARNLATTSPLLVASENTIILPGYNHDERLHSECYISVSNDMGLNWSSPSLVLKSSSVSLSEPAIVRYRDNLILIARSDDDNMNMHSVESYDNGKTWTTPKDLGFPGQAPYLLNVGDSMLLLAQRNPLTSIRISNDESLNFSKPYLIDNDYGAYGAYPSVAHVHGKKFLISYYVEADENQRSELRFKQVTINNQEVEISEVISKIFIEPLHVNE